eukprot:s1601_g3.t1
MSLALAGDLRVGCREKARFMPTFVKLGLGGAGDSAGYLPAKVVCELGTSYFLPRLVGRGRAAAHLLTGKEISTEQAEQWGLLNEVVEEAELAACCRKHAKELLGLSPKGLRLTKWLLNHSQEGMEMELGATQLDTE